MRVKKYTAGDMPAAMALIRDDLGPDAIILHSEKKRQRGLSGWFRQPALEVIAAVDTDLHDFPHPTPAADDDIKKMQRELTALKMTLAQVTERRSAPSKPGRAGAKHGTLAALSPAASIEQWYLRLLNQGVMPDLARQIVQTVADELNRWALDDQAVLDEHLHWHLSRQLTAPAPIALTPGQPLVFFVVGPTGVGKTSTLAKLAANISRGYNARVMMITTDTFRVASIPQISTFGQIIGVPVKVAYSPQELAALVYENQRHDLILVDTPGRSQYASDQMAELRDYLSAVITKTVHLAMTAGTRYEDMQHILDTFSAMPLDGLIFTKTDETASFGPAYTLACETGLSLSYLTNGQRVPEDIQLASTERVIDLLVGSTPRGSDH